MGLEFILCHGSGNRFVMIDAIGQSVDESTFPDLSQDLCRKLSTDGALMLVRTPQGELSMRMFNPDGSEAEMCGNGMRCIARFAQRYTAEPSFTVVSGGRPYAISTEESIFDHIPTYGVEIAVSTSSPDFVLPYIGGRFVADVIAELDHTLRFTALSLGNPHIVAMVDNINYAKLEMLGESVKELPQIFPRGVNVSLFTKLSDNRIFVATYERGVGITASCGTAMTASSTAAVLIGMCDVGSTIEVCNRGGAVRCRCTIEGSAITTKLIGNATYESQGRLGDDGSIFIDYNFPKEANAYEAMLATIKY